MRPQAQPAPRPSMTWAATLLELVCAPRRGRRRRRGLTRSAGSPSTTPVDEPVLPGGPSCSGSGCNAPTDIAALLESLGKQDARGPGAAVAGDGRPGRAGGRPVVRPCRCYALTRGGVVDAARRAAAVRCLAEGDVGDDGPETLGGIPSGDLFSVANAVAALIDAPVTIRGPLLAGCSRFSGPAGRGGPVPGRDDPRPPGTRAVLAAARRARRVPRAVPLRPAGLHRARRPAGGCRDFRAAAGPPSPCGPGDEVLGVDLGRRCASR